MRLTFVIYAVIDILESKKAPRFLTICDGLMGITNCQGNIRKLSLLIIWCSDEEFCFLSHLISIYLHSSNFWYRWYNFVILKVHFTFHQVLLDQKIHTIVYHQRTRYNWLDDDVQFLQLVKCKYCNEWDQQPSLVPKLSVIGSDNSSAISTRLDHPVK